MSFYESFRNKVISTTTETFNEHALELFDYQYHTNPVYRQYCRSLGRTPSNSKELTNIPFLPIDFFKQHTIKSEVWMEECTFLSSGTTLQTRSRHFIRNLEFYHHIARTGFERMYGSLDDYQLFALLPSYLEQPNSSLISMVDQFLTLTQSGSGYFLNDGSLYSKLDSTKNKILLGVSFALLDTVENGYITLQNGIVMETGGMKGRRKELIRDDLHRALSIGFGVPVIHSEYGMTELSSQAYSRSKGLFEFPEWAQVSIRDINDPFTYLESSRTGGINVIDLANVSTCAFIETMDLGLQQPDKSFQVLGRFDNSDIRGCNLLTS